MPGVWVCEGSGLGLSPTLFLQALCPDPDPRSLLVKWKRRRSTETFSIDKNLAVSLQ